MASQKTPSQLFRQLTRKANLSNQVSADAFIQAQKIWSDYVKTVTSKRNAQDVKDVFAKLVIINNQIHWGLCKIEPTQWHSFCTLFCLIKDCSDNSTILEPLDDDAANDDSNDAEAA